MFPGGSLRDLFGELLLREKQDYWPGNGPWPAEWCPVHTSILGEWGVGALDQCIMRKVSRKKYTAVISLSNELFLVVKQDYWHGNPPLADAQGWGGGVSAFLCTNANTGNVSRKKTQQQYPYKISCCWLKTMTMCFGHFCSKTYRERRMKNE